ncbi:Sjogren's syndrome/scleroderma autoantigen 1 family protein [Haladaptatus sp. DJG-WS-42]|uniref:Sjogren's syndrome/scleroderma autoantigen 1 family protein n=1 Tax=Haladaptatus sp. DJG-WS-42 TaxID=3120516 RepID=UPI0030CF16F7
MSGFDKEAERQRLREQFKKDEANRKETERMSELLLKGATMTNKHCDTCGDPIFRYQGQEFCATCEGNKQDARDAQAQQAQQNQQTQQSQADQSTQPQPEAENGAHPVEQAAAEAKANELEAAQQAAESAMDDLGEQATEIARAPPQSTPQNSPATQTADLTQAQQSLVRTLTKLTEAAEQEDDVGRTKEYLEAAHEAADALAAVKKAGR